MYIYIHIYIHIYINIYIYIYVCIYVSMYVSVVCMWHRRVAWTCIALSPIAHTIRPKTHWSATPTWCWPSKQPTSRRLACLPPPSITVQPCWAALSENCCRSTKRSSSTRLWKMLWKGRPLCNLIAQLLEWCVCFFVCSRFTATFTTTVKSTVA